MISYVIPTLGTRPDSLKKLIFSLLKAKSVEKIFIIGPIEIESKIEIHEPRIQFLKELSKGAPSAINQGLNQVESKYWNWIGDDDFVSGIDLDAFFLKNIPLTGENLYYSNIKYVDNQGNFLMWNKPRKIAQKIIFFGPNLIPQPTCIFPTRISVLIGGLSEKYHLAFDQDFICRLLFQVEARYVSYNFASYTWHGDSLTQKNRFLSFEESFQIRMQYANNWRNKLLIRILYLPTIGLILVTDLIFRKVKGNHSND
jgi:hypothetical protein